MDKIVVKGGKRLTGQVEVSGAKNAALPILASSLLADGAHTYRNVPHLADVTTMLKVLRTMGCEAERHEGSASTSMMPLMCVVLFTVCAAAS